MEKFELLIPNLNSGRITPKVWVIISKRLRLHFNKYEKYFLIPFVESYLAYNISDTLFDYRIRFLMMRSYKHEIYPTFKQYNIGS